jgi:hypothetical protein
MYDRPHVEFVQTQLIPWRRIGPGAARPDVEYKFLSRDASTGACSTILRYPPGWRREGVEHVLADEELYVLDGELLIDGRRYGPDTYAFLPKGWPREHAEARAGAVVLSYFSEEPAWRPGRAENCRVERAVPFLDVLHMPWDMKVNDDNLSYLGISRKDLRRDAETGERTFLSMMLPQSEPPGRTGRQERHPVVEEAFLISGSLTGPQGTMHAGAYFWRPPSIAHGPFGTHWGAVALIRFLGGTHVNQWGDEASFSFDAPYNPVLPPDLDHLRYAPWRPAPTY